MDVRKLGGQRLGKYELRERLGVGGMAAVYQGYQADLDREVAIKVLSDRLATQPGYMERFTLEARVIAKLEHSHIVPIYDYGTQNGLSYVVMRALTGGTLSQRLEKRVNERKLPSLGEVSSMLSQLAGALDYAHQRGVIHRDIKTGNVMFDDQGDTYLVDFGIVKLAQGNVQLTQEGMIIGTPTYMAPEQWRDDELTPAVDQYALAVLIYATLTGRLPFDADTSHALMYQHLNEDPPNPHDLREGVPDAVGDVLSWALAKDPAERYPSITIFAEAFADAIKGHEGEDTNFFRFRLPPKTDKQDKPVTPPPIDPTVANEPPAPADATIQNMRVIPSAKATAEHQVVTPTSQPTIQSSAPPTNRAVPIPMQQSEPPMQAAPYIAPPEQKRKEKPVDTTTRFGMGVLLGLVLLGAIVIVGGLILMSVLGGNDDDNNDNDTTDTNGQIIDPIDSQVDNSPTTIPEINVTEIGGLGLTSAITVDNAINMQSVVRWNDGTNPFRSIAFSTNGRFYAGGKGDGSIVLWDASSNTEVRRISAHDGIVYAVEFDRGGVRLASAGADNWIRMWDVATGSLLFTLPGHTGQVRDLAFSPDGNLIASASEDETIRIWDANIGTPIATLTGHSARVLSIAFSPDGTRLLSGANDNLLMLWDVQAGTRIATLNQHQEQVRAVVWSPDGSTFASSSTDNTAIIWNANNQSVLHVLRDHERDVFSLAYSPDGAILATGGRDNNIIIWEVATGTNLNLLAGHFGWVNDLQFDADGAILISGSGDGDVRIWGNP